MNLTVAITGDAPLLMHSAMLADPLNPYSRAIKAIKKDRRRTEEMEEQAALLEWRGSIYHDAAVGPYIPAVNLESMVIQAARKWRKGKDAERAVRVAPTMVPLKYDGPRSLDELEKLPQFRDVRAAVMPSSGARVMRVRPIFEEWSIEFTILLNPEQLDAKDLRDILHRAGKEIGLGDWRPRYGTFEVDRIDG